MIVKSTWKRTIIIVALASSFSRANMFDDLTTSTESSSEYLRKVMLELRDLNLPPSQSLPAVRGTGSSFLDVNDKYNLAGKRHSSEKTITQQVVANSQQDNLGYRASMLQPIVSKKIEPVTVDQMIAETATNNKYYQLPGAAVLPPPKKASSPEVSSLTNPELNDIYKHAIETGSVVSLNALANVLRHRQLPSAMMNQVDIGESQPMYSYYFYPLKSFMNDVRHGNGMLPAMNLRPENTGLVHDSQKEIGNPLFMAISGFIGMAVLFMIGVLLLPRLGDFTSRVVNDDKDFLDLTKTVGEAIDHQKCSQEVTHPFNSHLDETSRFPCQPARIPKPSSVVMLTRKSGLQKVATKRRRKISKKCKISPCKKDIERVAPT